MEVRQGGLVFRWHGGRRVHVFDKEYRVLRALDVKPAQGHVLVLDDVHDAIDEHVASLTNTEPIG